MTSLFKTETLLIQRQGGQYNDKGVLKRLTGISFIIKANVQPLDFMSSGAITKVMGELGERVTNMVKVYTKTHLENGDIVTRVKTGKRYRIWKDYDYDEYGLDADHRKYIMSMVED